MGSKKGNQVTLRSRFYNNKARALKSCDFTFEDTVGAQKLIIMSKVFQGRNFKEQQAYLDFNLVSNLGDKESLLDYLFIGIDLDKKFDITYI